MKKINHQNLSGGRKELLKDMPRKAWEDEKEYDYLFLVPSGLKHDSGYMVIYIIGVVMKNGEEWAEIAASCDDICWNFPKEHPYDGIREGVHMMMLRSDCLYPSGIIRMWASRENRFETKFLIGSSLSSTDVTLIVREVIKK